MPVRRALRAFSPGHLGRAGGGDVTRLTFNKAGDGLPAWSPNGRKIAFASDRAGSPDIHTMRANGHNQLNRTNKKSFDYAPDWGALDRRSAG